MTDDIKVITEEDIQVEAESVEPKDIAKRKYETILKMIEGRDAKIKNATEHLNEILIITATKYLTANGMMAAMDTINEVNPELKWTEKINIALDTSRMLSALTNKIAEELAEASPTEYNTVIEQHYDRDFVWQLKTEEEPLSFVEDIVMELMTLHLCSNIGPSADDIVQFIKATQEEIDKSVNDYNEYCEANNMEAQTIEYVRY